MQRAIGGKFASQEAAIEGLGEGTAHAGFQIETRMIPDQRFQTEWRDVRPVPARLEIVARFPILQPPGRHDREVFVPSPVRRKSGKASTMPAVSTVGSRIDNPHQRFETSNENLQRVVCAGSPVSR